MHTVATTLIAVTSLAGANVAAGALVARDSADFVNAANGGSTAHYEADLIPQHATPSWDSPGQGQDYGVNDSELTLTTQTTSGNRFFHDTSGFWSNDVNPAVGYTVEFRMRIDEITDATRGPVFMRIADGSRQVELEWRTNQIVWNGTGAEFTASGFHSYRIAYDPTADEGAGAYTAWIDGALIADSLTGVSSSTNHLLFGDTSNARYGGTTTWDYVRWDTTGAYAPIPEPASIAMLAFGTALLVRRRRE